MRVFVSSSPHDEKLKRDLLTHLAPAVRNRSLALWHSGNLVPGDEISRVTEDELERADLALILLSDSYLAPEGPACQDLARIDERRRRNGLRVVPIVLLPCSWQQEHLIKDLQVLPRDGRPIKRRGDSDEAFVEVCREVVALCAGATRPRLPPVLKWAALLVMLVLAVWGVSVFYPHPPKSLRCVLPEDDACAPGQQSVHAVGHDSKTAGFGGSAAPALAVPKAMPPTSLSARVPDAPPAVSIGVGSERSVKTVPQQGTPAKLAPYRRAHPSAEQWRPTFTTPGQAAYLREHPDHTDSSEQ